MTFFGNIKVVDHDVLFHRLPLMLRLLMGIAGLEIARTPR
jgi:hypothetical protein